MHNNSEAIILLSTYNGEKYIKQQIDSLYTQTYKNFEIIVRDDKSSDNTIEILKTHENIKLMATTENLGAKNSFATLLEYAVKNTDADYFMFCDQDDVWKKDKIEKTLKKMKNLEIKFSNKPILIHTDLEVVDEKLNILNKSFWHYEHISPSLNSLNKLLMQNTITGCAVMINKKLAQLALPIPKESIMHDWWLGLVASKFGKIGFMNESTIKYRQHKNNDTGANKFGLYYIINKIKNFKHINIQQNILQAKAFLEQFESELDVDTKMMLEDFSNIEEKSFWQKRKILLKHKLLKQGFIRNIGLLFKI